MVIKLCTKARDAIVKRSFVGWQGLPAKCHSKDLLPEIPADLNDWPDRYLGDDFQKTKFAVLTMEGYYRPTASLIGEEIVMFDGMNPDLPGGFAPLQADLGEPVERFDWFYGTLEIKAGEWPFPDRGITVFLNSTADRVLHIALYHPAAMSSYIHTLRPPLRKTLNK
jgi:hypothetical protein